METALLSFFLYLLIIIIIGVLSAKFSSSGLSEFFLAGRKLKQFVVALSAVVSGRSAWLLVGVTGMAFTIGAPAVWAVTGYITTDEELYESFEISQSNGVLDKPTGHYQVKATVKNTGDETAKQIKVIGKLYDKEDKIIEVSSTYIKEPLSPGDAALFEITVTDKNIAERIKTYRIQAVEHEGNS